MLETDPEPAGIKCQNGVFAYANQAYKKLVNMQGRTISGLTDSEMPCDTSEFAPTFVQQDLHAILTSSTVTTLDIHNYSHGYDAYTFIKSPLFLNGRPWGTRFRGLPVRQIMNSIIYAEIQSGLVGSSDGVITSIPAEKINLTDKQGIVLYWVLRGKTSKEVARITGRSSKTIDKHVSSIIDKFRHYGVYDRKTLFAHCRANGWFSYMPDGLLSRPISAILSDGVTV